MDLPPAPTPPVGSSQPQSERSSSLLNLLKFSSAGSAAPLQPTQQQQQQPSPSHQNGQHQHHQQAPSQSQMPFPAQIHQPSPGSADPTGLLAALMRGTPDRPSPAAKASQQGSSPAHQQTPQQQTPQQQPSTNPFGNGSPPDDTRSFLLNLLNRPKPSQTDSLLTETAKAATQSAQPALSNGRLTQEPVSPPIKIEPDVSSLLQLIGSPQGSASSPALQILKRDDGSPASVRSQPKSRASDVSPRGFRDGPKDPVAHMINEIARDADRDARDALEHAEQEAQTAEMDGNAAVEHLTERVQTLHDVNADDVADSWENDDQNEIVVIEEPEMPPVSVYNFPMKPWISITLQDGSIEGRPEFREESVMDIARLKKEFDQMDRNLYTASETYMTYGMSKQGGLRVIRQEDGKDAKVFTATKDRVFNVSMSVTPSDHDGVSREAIIGTGISGTVYWVQIKEGEKDHIEDANLEQYGFVLPPLPAQEGDAPSGLLKTRARASTSHPEYFAMGRGKCIHFIWPSYILQNNLFKSTHDRIADTEKLFQECSLKINTGKAGKDFTFSQDDSVVVSLDKSGRVKFWDVRELTEVKEGSSSRAPMPAHSNLEVKTPLMTLASTPEGEKAWPTSVLLLDKQRPYQKRCALRYMIVGMKQNHTLQLWDLALGKPVQEFNLPHSKESDAVCSVMYHPASGMIVIGHPTRNSIYFAHLSAPKYNLKSVSQAEYMERLAVQDPSIPQPDSTAVISGIREYSFSNRGILRSLDILASPAMSSDVEEPTLFELYAMHSKGVACLLVKQHELGWSRDNKVLHAVDAVEAGVVTVAKLKSTQPAEPAAAESRPAAKSSAKDITAQGSMSDTATKTGSEAAPTPVKKADKEVETPVPSSKESNPTEKPDRKSRKKKAKEAEAASTHATPSKSEPARATSSTAGTVGLSSDVLDAAIASLETRVTASISDTLKSSLRNLQSKIDEGARVRDESFNLHQVKLLDMVSEVLNDNTQKVLESLIHRQFTELVIPAIGEKASKSVTEVLNSKLQPSVVAAVQKEIQSAVPQAVNRSLRSGDFVSSIADRVGPAVSVSLQQELAASLTHRLTPALSNAAAQSAQRSVSEMHQQYQEQIERLQAQHRADASKMDLLLSHMTRMSETMSSMATSQAALQAEFNKFKLQQVHELPAIGQFGGPSQSNVGSQGRGNVGGSSLHGGHMSSLDSQGPQYMGSPQYGNSRNLHSPPGSIAPSEHLGPGPVSNVAGAYANQMSRSEVDASNDLSQRIQLIEQAIQEGRLQDAIIQWVQSQRKDEIFQLCLSRYPPGRFDNLSPLMLLVVIATLAKDLHVNPSIKDQVEWIEMAIRSFAEAVSSYDLDREDFRDVMQSAPATMDMVLAKVVPVLEAMHDRYPTDPFLMKLNRAKLERIVQLANHILNLANSQRH